jgi:hypothetical protein
VASSEAYRFITGFLQNGHLCSSTISGHFTIMLKIKNTLEKSNVVDE